MAEWCKAFKENKGTAEDPWFASRPGQSFKKVSTSDEVQLLIAAQLQINRLTSTVAVAVRRSVFVEEAETKEVDQEAEGSDVEDHLRVVDLLRFVEPLQALHGDGEAESDEKDCVDQGTCKRQIRVRL